MRRALTYCMATAAAIAGVVMCACGLGIQSANEAKMIAAPFPAVGWVGLVLLCIGAVGIVAMRERPAA